MIQSPFKFLDAYEKEDKDIFFGREKESKALFDLVLQANLTVLYGFSGTGKTSLIRCGLANQFQTHDWKEIFIRRKNNLNDSLWAELQKNAVTPFQDLDGNGTISLREAIESLFLDYFTPIYLIFDQFEELFILGNAKEQNEFMESIAELLAGGQNCHIIFSIREEYLGELYEFEQKIPHLLQSRLRVELMSSENLKKVIRGTTQKNKIGIDHENTIEQILGNIGGKRVSLPYLQVYLDKLYRKAYQKDEKTVFTEKLVQETGQIQDVLEDFLKERIAETDQKFGEKDLCRKILNEFLSSEGTKRPCEWEYIQSKNLVESEKLRAILLHLTHSRILVGEENRYELAHDSLAAAIERLRTAEEKAIADIRKMLHESLQNYQRNGSLLTAENLNYILKNPYFEKVKLENAEKELLAKSKAKVRREKIITYTVIATISVLLVWALFAQYQANRETEKAEKAKTEAVEEKNKAKKAQQAAVNALKVAYTGKIQELENTKSVLESDNRTQQAKEYQLKIDSIQDLIKKLE